METYHKIPTVFLRNPETKYKTLLDTFAKPEFRYLQYTFWEFTEKIDGMNIRIDYDGQGSVDWAGRTDKAEIPKPLVDRLFKIGENIVFGDVVGGPVTLYGEGFGGKIQKGGAYGEQDFVLFDVLAKGIWLDRAAVQSIATGLGIKYAPVVLRGGLDDGIKLVELGFQSAFGDRPQAEGLVMRPAVEMRNQYGERVIAKLKCKDFPR